MSARWASSGRRRLRVTVTGLVQGVGFRPFVHALAHELGLSGWATNTPDGVLTEVEGAPDPLAAFVRRVCTDAPTLADVWAVTTEAITPIGGTGFEIRESSTGAGRTLVSADVATCPDCMRDLTTPGNRRHRHPFVTCTNCGPRFTIVTTLPYDRPNTTMAGFAMCPDCTAEYTDPADRRFHAQPIACPACGPTLALDQPGAARREGEDALAEAKRLLADGAVLAVKGLGGYHLACDASDASAVGLLRKRKQRGDKPFAVMVADADAAEAVVVTTRIERDLLTGHHRPIVLLPRRDGSAAEVCADVAPGNPDLGVMTPYTPLHHLLLDDRRVLVMTSGNVAGEPIVTNDDDARERLAALADAWLTHDRPIHVPCDDSVVRVVDGEPLPVRRSRGYAPLPLHLPFPTEPVLAVGADVKNTFCLAAGRQGWMSAHVGDMDDYRTLQAFTAAEQHLEAVTGIAPAALVADAHPSYRSSAWARTHADGRPVHLVQHHHAHVASTLADNGHPGDRPVLGIAFDGTGYGTDGAVWGGEFLLADYSGARRVAHLAYVPLPGGDAGVRNPCRMALAHLHAAGIAWSPGLPSVPAASPDERRVLAHQLETGLACTPTSSMGRLYDAVSSLVGARHRIEYDAQAAIDLEAAARRAVDAPGSYTFAVPDDLGAVSCAPVVRAVVNDVTAGVSPDLVAVRFHRAVVGLVVDVATRAREREQVGEVTLSGGVFVNTLLTTWCTRALRERGFVVLRHRHVPPTDAGLALGQVAIHAHSPEVEPHAHDESAVEPRETERTCV